MPPAPLAFAETCRATVTYAKNYKCTVTVIGPGRFTGSLQTGNDIDFSWSVSVPTGVTCPRTSGHADEGDGPGARTGRSFHGVAGLGQRHRAVGGCAAEGTR